MAEIRYRGFKILVEENAQAWMKAEGKPNQWASYHVYYPGINTYALSTKTLEEAKRNIDEIIKRRRAQGR